MGRNKTKKKGPSKGKEDINRKILNAITLNQQQTPSNPVSQKNKVSSNAQKGACSNQPASSSGLATSSSSKSKSESKENKARSNVLEGACATLEVALPGLATSPSSKSKVKENKASNNVHKVVCSSLAAALSSMVISSSSNDKSESKENEARSSVNIGASSSLAAALSCLATSSSSNDKSECKENKANSNAPKGACATPEMALPGLATSPGSKSKEKESKASSNARKGACSTLAAASSGGLATSLSSRFKSKSIETDEEILMEMLDIEATRLSLATEQSETRLKRSDEVYRENEQLKENLAYFMALNTALNETVAFIEPDLQLMIEPALKLNAMVLKATKINEELTATLKLAAAEEMKDKSQ